MANGTNQQCEHLKRFQEEGQGRLGRRRSVGTGPGRVRRQSADVDEKVESSLQNIYRMAKVVIRDKGIVRCSAGDEKRDELI